MTDNKLAVFGSESVTKCNRLKMEASGREKIPDRCCRCGNIVAAYSIYKNNPLLPKGLLKAIIHYKG